jgi:hypothetical protein
MQARGQKHLQQVGQHSTVQVFDSADSHPLRFQRVDAGKENPQRLHPCPILALASIVGNG